MAQPMFKNAWKVMAMTQLPAAMAPKLSGAARTMRMPDHRNTRNSATTNSAPTMPSSSPMIAKMKSLSDENRYRHFSCELPRPTPKRPPSANA